MTLSEYVWNWINALAWTNLATNSSNFKIHSQDHKKNKNALYDWLIILWLLHNSTVKKSTCTTGTGFKFLFYKTISSIQHVCLYLQCTILTPTTRTLTWSVKTERKSQTERSAYRRWPRSGRSAHTSTTTDTYRAGPVCCSHWNWYKFNPSLLYVLP